MKHKSDFCVLILSHGRPNKVVTVETLKRSGYTGDWYIVLDSFDETKDQYIEKFGKEHVVVFDKEKAMSAAHTDSMDNFQFHKSILWARQASIDVAKTLGYRYFAEFEDDYNFIRWRIGVDGEYSSHKITTDTSYRLLDKIFDAMLDYLIETPRLSSICMAQSGDYIGGGNSTLAKNQWHRKAMNSWIIDTERPFDFSGTMNDDVNAYTKLAMTGTLFLTTGVVALNQAVTQAQASGNADMYKTFGTYVKSFYSVMGCPSAVKIGTLVSSGKNGKKINLDLFRVHHHVTWNNVAPKILNEKHRKPRDTE